MPPASAVGVPVWLLTLYSKRSASSESGVRTTRDNAIMGLVGRRGMPSWTRKTRARGRPKPTGERNADIIAAVGEGQDSLPRLRRAVDLQPCSCRLRNEN